MDCLLSRREATDRQIEQDRVKRLQLEAAKAEELQQQRQQLQQWQQNLTPGATQQQQQVEQGDESDYEPSDDAEEPACSSHICSQQQQQLVEEGEEGVMPDHPDYHGRGWSAVKAGVAGNGVPGPGSSQMQDICEGQEVQANGLKAPLEGSREGLASSSLSSPHSSDDMPFLQAGPHPPGQSSSAACMQQLQQEEGELEGCPKVLDAMLGSSSSFAVGTNSRGGNTTTEATAPLLQEVHTVRSKAGASVSAQHEESSSSSSNRSMVTGVQPSTSGAAQAAPPPPVRSTRVAVPVGFTQLETPHLPARETRELEIKALKRAQKVKVSFEAPCTISLFHFQSLFHLLYLGLQVVHMTLADSCDSRHVPYCSVLASARPC